MLFTQKRDRHPFLGDAYLFFVLFGGAIIFSRIWFAVSGVNEVSRHGGVLKDFLQVLITLLLGSLGQLVGLCLLQLIKRLFYIALYESLELPLDNFPRLVVHFSRTWFVVSFRMVCRNFILAEIGKPYLFFLCLFAKLIVPYR